MAVRGTLELVGDILPTDNDIAQRGAAYDQIAALHNWWQRVSQAGGMVPQYRVTEYPLSSAPESSLLLYRANGQAVERVVVLERIADAPATGDLVAALANDPDGKLDVTGHSLGGHLAMAFAAMFPQATASVTAFNAPGFLNSSVNAHFFAQLGGTVPTDQSIGAITTNVVANHTSDSEAPWQGIAMLHSRPGTPIDVPIERQDVLGPEPIKPASLNHSQVILTDALAVYALMDRLAPGISTGAVGEFLRRAADSEHAGLEGLVSAIHGGLGLGRASVPAGNDQRDALYRTIAAVSDFLDGEGRALEGQLLIRPSTADLRAVARNDFGAALALQSLSPLWITGAHATADAALNAAWQAGFPADYAAWLADKTSPTPSTYTDTWLADRSALLQAITTRNTQDNTTQQVFDAAAPAARVTVFRYADPAGQASLLATSASAVPGQPDQYIVFGGAGHERITGTDNRLPDRLYGGAGRDTLVGGAGDDYLQGDEDMDDLDGGEGADTLVGGEVTTATSCARRPCWPRTPSSTATAWGRCGCMAAMAAPSC